MSWLNLVLGKKSARTVKKVQKMASALSAPPKAETKVAAPKVVWLKSENGNDTTEVDGFRVTVFKQDDGWTYVASELLDAEDIAEGMTDEPEFGDWYPTKAEAKRAALEEFG